MARKLKETERREFEEALLLAENEDLSREWKELLSGISPQRNTVSAVPQDFAYLIADWKFKTQSG